MKTRMFATAVALVAFFSATASAAPFQFVPDDDVQRVVAGLEAATGSRDAGAFGRHGDEALGYVDVRLAADWAIAAQARTANNRIDDRAERSYAVELRYLGWGGGWATGLGYRDDAAGVTIPFLRAAWVEPATAHPWAFSAVLEMPQQRDAAGNRRDAADLIVATGKAFACGAWLHCAIELAGEDLEGFVDASEAEGGAKFLLGPTVSAAQRQGLRIKLFAGWIHAATANEPARADHADYRGRRDGAILRVSAAFGN